MKTLQNNFTTLEQSKRLLVIGVPANSADCIYVRFSKKDKFSRKFRDNVVSENPYEYFDFYYPCWSVGRLIEISLICGIGDKVPNELNINKYSLVDSLVENIISRLERVADLSVNDIDFSKLEE